MESKLKSLQELRRFLKDIAKRVPKARKALFLKHPSKMKTFYRYHNLIGENTIELYSINFGVEHCETTSRKSVLKRLERSKRHYQGTVPFKPSIVHQGPQGFRP
jgi:hypothetical protein